MHDVHCIYRQMLDTVERKQPLMQFCGLHAASDGMALSRPTHGCWRLQQRQQWLQKTLHGTLPPLEYDNIEPTKLVFNSSGRKQMAEWPVFDVTELVCM